MLHSRINSRLTYEKRKWAVFLLLFFLAVTSYQFLSSIRYSISLFRETTLPTIKFWSPVVRVVLLFTKSNEDFTLFRYIQMFRVDVRKNSDDTLEKKET